ncbi:nucleolar protein 16-like isoform X1 [Salvelinus fontinalis]|uniref:nucleolar protein 16-like isoform X1 n=1 Tax=Salvelinus fontinalis TaxID=8038 RepID=UPI002486628E|nr:nucleolar protein 16-like isoform X1 [Salvelinus fontinalis]
MPKAKKKSKRNKFDYGKDRKKLKKQFKKREAPRIECPQIRNAWSDKKSVARNLRDMGLAFDPNRALPIKTPAIAAVGRTEDAPAPKLVRKPYVLNELMAEASLAEKDTKTLSTDLIEYVQYMVREHSENYKIFFYFCRLWPEMRRTITRTRPHRSGGKWTSINAAIQRNTPPSWSLSKVGKQFPHNCGSCCGQRLSLSVGDSLGALTRKYSVTVAKMNKRGGQSSPRNTSFHHLEQTVSRDFAEL